MILRKVRFWVTYVTVDFEGFGFRVPGFRLLCGNTRLLNHKGSKLPHKEFRVTHVGQRTQRRTCAGCRFNTNYTNFTNTLMIPHGEGPVGL